MQVKIERINKRDTKSDGTKLINKYDKPYFSIGIKPEGSDEWLSGFANNNQDPMYNLQEGGTYSISVTEKVVGDKTYKNFKLLTPEEKEVEDMKAELAALKAFKETLSTTVAGAATVPEAEVNLDSF